MIRRPPRSTLSSSSAASDVYKRQQLMLGKNVSEIDPKQKAVKMSDGTMEEYDKLVIATGSESFIPELKGIEKKGVFAIRNLENINEIRSYIEEGVKQAAILGSGVLGLEAAWELKKVGLDVTVVGTSKVIMNKQLDAKGSEFLKSAMAKSGVHLITGKNIDEITGKDKVTSVRLDDGTVIEAQIMVISTGISQNVELAKAIGIETNKSIVVNNKMETGISDIYACGV